MSQLLLANPEGDRKGPRSTPRLSRPYNDTERLRQQYLSRLCQMIILLKIIRILIHALSADQSAMGAIMLFNFFMGTSEHPARADQSAMGAINWPLRMSRLLCYMP
jgi:hypothetical protein